MKTVIIVQARMGSTRLPGKVLKQVLGKSLLEYQLDRLRLVKLADEIVIATTTNDKDEPIVNLCDKLNIPYYRGPEEDVLARYYGAAVNYKADIIIRITADCPLIDPGVVDKVIKWYLDHQENYDYVSNTLHRTYPRGMDTEVFPFDILNEAYEKATTLPEREHVTPYIYNRPEKFRLYNVAYKENKRHHRWTVDTPEDFELIKKIITALYPKKPYFTLEDILNLLDKNPAWQTINAHVRQKVYGQ